MSGMQSTAQKSLENEHAHESNAQKTLKWFSKQNGQKKQLESKNCPAGVKHHTQMVWYPRKNKAAYSKYAKSKWTKAKAARWSKYRKPYAQRRLTAFGNKNDNQWN